MSPTGVIGEILIVVIPGILGISLLRTLLGKTLLPSYYMPALLVLSVCAVGLVLVDIAKSLRNMGR